MEKKKAVSRKQHTKSNKKAEILSMKKKRRYLILIALIALLGVATAVLLKIKPKEEDAENSEIQLVSADAKSIQNIQVSNNEGDYSIEMSDGEYCLTGIDQNYSLDAARLEAAVRNLSQISGEKVADEADGKYGFSQPVATVHISGEQETVTLYLGAYNEGLECWYVQKDNEPAVYAIADGKGQWMRNSAYSYLDRTLIKSFDRENETLTERLNKVIIERPDLIEPIVIESIDETPAAYTSAYEIVSPVRVKTSYQAMNDNIAALLGLTADSVAGIYDTADTEKYGMNSAAMILTVDHDGIEEVFTVGKKQEDGVYYLISDQRDLLYTISEEKLSLFHVTVDDLFFGLALVPDINSVQEVKLFLKGEDYDFVIDSNGDNVIKDIKLGDQILDEDNFRDFYSLLIAVDVQKLSAEEANGDPVLSIGYIYKDGTEDWIDGYASGARDMLLALNGKVQYKGRVAFLEKLDTEVQNLLSGKDVNTDW